MKAFHSQPTQLTHCSVFFPAQCCIQWSGRCLSWNVAVRRQSRGGECVWRRIPRAMSSPIMPRPELNGESIVTLSGGQLDKTFLLPSSLLLLASLFFLPCLLSKIPLRLLLTFFFFISTPSFSAGLSDLVHLQPPLHSKVSLQPFLSFVFFFFNVLLPSSVDFHFLFFFLPPPFPRSSVFWGYSEIWETTRQARKKKKKAETL